MTARIPFTERLTPWRGILDLVTGCYPSFLFGFDVRQWLPVFHFHDITHEQLEPYLHYLAENGYTTVVSDDVSRLVRQGLHPGPKSVALCFDDAWASLSSVVAPLLKQYGFRAITYVSPALIMETASPDNPFVTWDDLHKLHESGIIDVQAHTLYHGMVFCGDEIEDFIRPGHTRHIHSHPLVSRDGHKQILSPRDLGAPLYPQRSRMSDALAYDNPAAREACMRHVRDNGGASFFEQPDWEQDLLRIAAGAGPGHKETAQERDTEILAELTEAREILNSRLGSHTVRHMCFPWAICGRAAEHAAEKAGYETAFGDRLFGRRAVRAGDNPYRLMRLKHNHIYRLPGKRSTPWP